VLVLEGNDAALWLWVDKELGMSLRYEARVGRGIVGGVQDEITRLDLDADMDASLFEFEPPMGAREVLPPILGR
jgi:outer membrane lipoprotein-sorting protein